jgi:phosphoribosylformimino-5-aminoimidazole carboxamide ribotide isomerase
VSIPVQLGGGVRTMASIEGWIEGGVSRVILGTVAVKDPALVRAAAKAWPEQIAVAIDARNGKVATEGWVGDSDLGVIELARRFEDAGVAALIVTDIGRDGAMTGVNIDQVGEVADAVAIPVIASGGIASVRDIELLKARKGAAIAGAVLGRSLYEGAVDPQQALKIAG